MELLQNGKTFKNIFFQPDITEVHHRVCFNEHNNRTYHVVLSYGLNEKEHVKTYKSIKEMINSYYIL